MPDSVRVPTKQLLDILAYARGFVADKGLVPGLRHLYAAGTFLTAFNGSCGIVCCLPWEVPRFALPADRFVALVASLAAQQVETLELSVTPTRVLVRGGTFSGWLSVPVDDLVDEMFREPTNQISKEALPLPAGWGQDLERVEWGAGTNETRVSLLGVQWTALGVLISSDGVRATALRPGPDSPRCPNPAGLMLPVHVLARLGVRRHELRAIEADDNGLTLTLPDAFLYGRLIEGGFPTQTLASVFGELQRSLQDPAGTWVQIRPDQPTAQVLDRLCLVADPNGTPLSVQIDPTGLRVSSSSPELHGGEETLLAQVAGPGGSFRVNGRYFAEACARALTFWYRPESPLYFLSDDRRLEHLLLLLRNTAPTPGP